MSGDVAQLDSARLARIHSSVARSSADRFDGVPPPDEPHAMVSPKVSDPPPALPAGPMWIKPLATFVGDAEPDTDDSADWIIRDIVPRAELAIIGGPPKSGKTTTALDLLISISIGRPWLGYENCLGRPGKALAILLEDSERRLARRLWEMTRARGLTPLDLADHLAITRRTVRIPHEREVMALAAEARAWGADVILIDNVTRVMVGDPNSTRDAKAFGDAAMMLGAESGAAVVLLHHTAKPPSDGRDARRPLDRLRGSGDFAAVVRNAVVLSPMSLPDGRATEIEIEGNLDLRRPTAAIGFEQGEEQGRRFARLVDLGDPAELRADVKAGKVADRTNETARRESVALQIAASAGSVSVAGLAAALSMSPATADRVLKSAVEKRLLYVGHKNDGHLLTEAGRRAGGLS
jgi:hypothetical protein